MERAIGCVRAGLAGMPPLGSLQGPTLWAPPLAFPEWWHPSPSPCAYFAPLTLPMPLACLTGLLRSSVLCRKGWLWPPPHHPRSVGLPLPGIREAWLEAADAGETDPHAPRARALGPTGGAA